MCGGTEQGLVSDSVANGTAAAKTTLSPDAVINLDHGDPTIFEPYWREMGDECKVTFEGHELLSYFCDMKNVCWFMEPKLEEEIRRLHRSVGNAVVEDYHLVVGTGSSQLINAVLYAIASTDEPEPQPYSVVAASPYYSYYPTIANYLRSRLYQWAGDAHTYDKDDGSYIEIITSPNNPDGVLREAVVSDDEAAGKRVYDLAYYWPQYTPITSQLNHDIMIFTASKCTGHAGSRLGWALVKDVEVAKKMTKYMEVSSIGVSRESQLRVAKILKVICDGCENPNSENFFEYGRRVMSERWERLNDVLKQSQMFSLSNYPLLHCNFTQQPTQPSPAFAWIKSEDSEDCESLLRGHKILTRTGKRFGTDARHVRVSMVSREDDFNFFLQRLSTIQSAHSELID